MDNTFQRPVPQPAMAARIAAEEDVYGEMDGARPRPRVFRRLRRRTVRRGKRVTKAVFFCLSRC